MSEKTQIKFFGVKAAPYPGAARDGCAPTAPEAVGWHVVVGGTQASISGVEDFAKFMGDFLQHAYDAGYKDARVELRDRLGL